MNNRLSKKSRPIVVILAFAAAAGFFLINLVNPNTGATAEADVQFAHVTDRFAGQHPQALNVTANYQPAAASYDSFSVETPKPVYTPPAVTAPAATGGGGVTTSHAAAKAPAPTAPAPSPGSAQAYAKQLLAGMGMGDDQYSCLVSLWNRESGWNVYAANPSGAYGIPQALPGSKMASAGPNWQSDYQTQIKWGLGYVDGRYGTPCGAWGHSQATGWY